MTVSLTPAAARHLQQVLQRHPDAVGLRFGVKSAGCAQYSYLVDVAQAINAEDQVFISEGMQIVVHTNALALIGDTQIDYQQQGLNANLIFNNPNAVSACGCGESFSVADK